MPVRVILPSKLRHVESTHSLESTAPTLVETNDGGDTVSIRDNVVDDCDEITKFANPFSKQPIVDDCDEIQIYPFTRRLRRFSDPILARDLHMPYTCEKGDFDPGS
ncbi:hypothetical protein DXG03_000359 [Asterophora parasitica]|uniref:Uncharacterized protein n=1 Tax=Asterophora parasitica TaxID=117018 RepID=A0A9P7GGS2_9AGAR|nr:hypothetical protein DXG03_000359 [Asterophora parasitica]